ncbi:hypothetical protein M4578_01510 [Salipiger sp. P9]|uniref:hypothetical protein n=1 Tax=Salipiger pentaromativorans TaxID=2943193 RepID=UPI0021570414|nr:hypothetical protein [Salipiger pentaromativorans]MCR8546489.1 hypothetical protein [Salipiger pentaromativorans]
MPLIALGLGALPGYWLGWTGRGGWGLALLAALAGAMIWTLAAARAAQGWDVLGHTIVLWLMLTPALLGLCLGAALGLYRRRRRGQKAGHD